jgi:hypothetical protein
VLRRIFGTKTEEVEEVGEHSIMRSFITCLLHHMLLGRLRQLEDSGHVARMGEMRNANNTFVGKSEGKRKLEDLSVDWTVILERIIEKWIGKIWTGFIWLRTGISGGVLKMFQKQGRRFLTVE